MPNVVAYAPNPAAEPRQKHSTVRSTRRLSTPPTREAKPNASSCYILSTDRCRSFHVLVPRANCLIPPNPAALRIDRQTAVRFPSSTPVGSSGTAGGVAAPGRVFFLLEAFFLDPGVGVGVPAGSGDSIGGTSTASSVTKFILLAGCPLVLRLAEWAGVGVGALNTAAALGAATGQNRNKGPGSENVYHVDLAKHDDYNTKRK